MKKPLLTILLSTLALYAIAQGAKSTPGNSRQSSRQWETLIGEHIGDSDDDVADWEETYDALCSLEQNPIDINTATKEDLERIPFLSDEEITAILEYIYRNGRMESMAELSMITALSPLKRQLLSYFTKTGEKKAKGFPKLKSILKYGNNELSLTGDLPLYERKGDKNGYLGYKYKHSLRYEYSYGNYLQAGIVGAQDSGEPFFADKNKLGYDFYSFYATIRNLGTVKNLTVGRYRIRMGLGLVMNNDLAFGKTATMTSMSRSGTTIRPHSSKSGYNYMQGAATTIRLGKSEKLQSDMTLFASYRYIDATLNDDGSIATIIKSDYHRTEKEMAKKNNSSQFAAGGNISFSWSGFHASLSGCYTTLSRTLRPDTKQLYRRHYATGKNFYNIGIDYGYSSGRFSFHGETATGDSKAWATLNAASLRLTSTLSLTAIQRFYSYRYHALLGRSFSEGGAVQNESGIYIGANWIPLQRFTISYYTDIVYFPWAKYQAAAPSHTIDNQLSLSYSSGAWTFASRYRLKIREKDNEQKTALTEQTTHRARLSAAVRQKRWGMKAQADMCYDKYKDRSFGYMATVGADVNATPWLTAYANIGYFNTQDYNSRIYLYERGLRYDFSFPAYYGEGVRYAMMLTANINTKIRTTLKIGVTDYFDRNPIGSALQQIDKSSLCDVSLQLRWKF